MTDSHGVYPYMALMLVAGATSMLLMKFQHMQMVPKSAGAVAEPFDHPLLQAAFMMVGETMCLPLFYIARKTSSDSAESSASSSAKNIPLWIFIVPCCCDLSGTSMLSFALDFVAVSVAQMCRGTIIIFACILSSIFLGKRQSCNDITGVSLVTLGIVLVAISAMLEDVASLTVGMTSQNMTRGISLCILAQVFGASMFVYEEKIMSQFSLQPLQVVGMEGLFGCFISFSLLTAQHQSGYTDVRGSFHQISSSPRLCGSLVASLFSIACFNFAGATVTKKSSAVSRTTVKMASTILIWVGELALGWNNFNVTQFYGFLLVAAGTVVYNQLVPVPLWMNSNVAAETDEQRQMEGADEHTALVSKATP